VLHINRPPVLTALALGALLIVALAVGRAVGPTYGSGIDDFTWQVSVSPKHPEVGDEIVVGFSASYSPAPYGQSPFFSQTPHISQIDEQPAVALIQHTDGYGAILRLRALRPGVAVVSVSGSFEKFGCPPPTPTPYPTSAPPFCFPKGFEFTTTPQIEITVAPSSCGDTNGDWRVNSIDAAWTLQYAAGLIQTLVFPADADVNSDGAVDAVDATLVLQVGAALIPLDALHCPPSMTP